MRKKEFVQRVTDLLKDTNIRKPVSVPKQVFHISDDNGNTRNFVIKQTDKSVGFTYEDVNTILDALIYTIKDALKHGENISIKGFGTLGVHFRKARATKHPETGEWISISERYIPKFTFGTELGECARAYEIALSSGELDKNIDEYPEEGEEDVE